jgi:hypothetical protein
MQFLLFLLILSAARSLDVQLQSDEEICFKVDTAGFKTLQILYVSTGFQDENVRMTISNPENKILAEKHGLKIYEEEFEVEIDGVHKICFHVTDTYFKIISFDF